MEQLWHYCCPACGKSFVDGPYWKANTNHSCPGRNGQMTSLVSSYNVLKAIPVTENELPWGERVNMISVNPHAATLNDIHRMAAELSEFLRGEKHETETEEKAGVTPAEAGSQFSGGEMG